HQRDWRVRLLHRLPPGPALPAVDHGSVVLGLTLRPQRLDRLHPLPQQRPAGLEGGAVVAHLLAVPAAADAEQKAPVGEAIEACGLLGRVDGIALDEKADARADQKRL